MANEEVTPQLGITTAQFDQYFAGGVFRQVSQADAGGPGTTYDQYAAGGTMGQLRVVCGSPTLDQRTPGGVWAQLAAGAA